MATTGIIQRRDVKANLIADPPLVGEIVFALDTYEFGTMIGGTLVWRSFSDIISSVNGYTGAVVLDKNDISLDQVDNTADIDKPVSTATQSAIDNAVANIPQSDWDETDITNKAYIQNKPVNITTQGNTFNNADELLQLDSNGKIPALDGSQLTNLPLELPAQTSNDNKFLTTDGTNPLWVNIDGNVSPITLKYSDVAGDVPGTSDITLGEFFINSNDGKVYFKKDDGTAQIIAISNDGHQHTISDITNLANALTLKIDTSEKASANGVATLDASGKIPSNQLPPLVISETFVTDSEVNQLALDVQPGDICIRTDINETYIALNSNNSNMSDWQEIRTPNSVDSVNGQTGTVALNTDDVSEGSSNLYFTITRAIDAIGASKDDNGVTPNDLWSANKIKTYVDTGINAVSAHQDTVDPDTFADSSNGYFIGQIWVNTDTANKFICVDNTNAAAIWERVDFEDGANVGTGYGIYKQRNDDTFEFRTLVSSDTDKLNITQNTNDISLDVNLNATNIGSGSQLYSGLNGSNFEFRTLEAGSTKLNIIENSDNISLDVNLNATNIGSGSQLYSGLNGANFEFRTLEAGSTKLNITENSDNITLDVIINDSGDTDQDIWSASKIQSQIDNIIIKETRDPASSDDMYNIGQIWVNTSNNAIYTCVDNTNTAAVWDRIIKEHMGIVNIDYPLVKIDNNILSADIDCSLGNIFNKDITSDTTFTFSNVPSGFFEIIIELSNAASYNVIFPSSVKYENNTAPTYSTHTDVLRMYTKDSGNTWFAKLDYSNVY